MMTLCLSSALTPARFCASALLGLFLTGCSDSPPPCYQGYVEGEFIHIAAAGAGRLERLQTAQGQSVLSNAPLFTLESALEGAARQQAEQQLQAAEAVLADLNAGKRPQELDVIRAQLAQAAAAERRSASRLERDQAQYQAEGISKAQLDDARAGAESDAARVQELKTQLAVAALPARDDQIRAQRAAVAAARAALEQGEWRLNQKTVAAPCSALVSETLYREGEWVPAGRPVIRLLPPENRKVRFFVPEPLLGRLAPGQAILLQLDGVNATIPATITYISTQSEYTPPVIYSQETRSKLVYMIEAHPAREKALLLHPGQPVAVRIP